jgi:signal transduction histidine kinase/tetratricopeptide (TPR) repeat protein
MIRLFKKDPTLRLRATRAYLVTLLTCVFLLFSFNIYSIYDQQHDARLNSSSELEFTAKEIAADLERRLNLLAAECLGAAALQSPAVLSAPDQSIETLASLRSRFEGLKRQYPVARHFFVTQGKRVLFPRTSMPEPRPIETFLPPKPGSEYRAYAEFLKRAENSEARLHKPAEAAVIYGRAAGMNVTDRLKAFALFRQARALEKAGEREAAVQAHRTLLNLYADQYDESDTPYAIVLALAPEGLAGEVFVSRRESLHQAYRDLLAGKWELSAGQAYLYLGKLEKLLGLDSSLRASSDFFEHLETAEALESSLSKEPGPKPHEITPRAFEYLARTQQAFGTLIPGAAGSGVAVRFSVSIPWITEDLLPSYLDEPRHVPLESVSLVEGTPAAGAGDSGADLYVALPTLLPSWQLRISNQGSKLGGMNAMPSLWYLGFVAFMFVSVFIIVLYLLIRVSGDIRWYRQRGEFVSGVSHDFKTPLSLIRLYSETLANDMDDFSPEERKNYIRIIARESERMSGLIDNVLQFSKIEQGRVRHEMKEGDLSATVSQTVADYAEYLEWHGFTVRTSVWPNVPPVSFNAEQVSQVILNLLDNARKYSGRSRLIRVNLWVQGDEVVVEVRDQGLGISSEEKARIFEPFYRASKGTEKGGCGLGLYLVSEVMKEHGGRIELESEVDKGSSFRLFFPVSGAHRARARKHKGSPLTVIDTGRGA